MRAVVLTRHGGPEVLQIAHVETPTPRPNEVRIKIRLIGLNFAEVLSRRGVYGWAPDLPYILGMEAFGHIDAVGSAVRDRRPGEPVIVGTQHGTYAEFLCVPSERALPAPRGYSPEQSAAFGVAYLTAWIGLMEMARLRPTDTVLVTSAAGGVGSAAVQIAKKFGATVIGAAGHGKQDVVLRLGADRAIDYSKPKWETEIGNPNVVLELVGGSVFKAAAANIAPMGRIVAAGASGAFPHSRKPLALLRAWRDMPRLRVFELLRRSYGVLCFHVGWLLDAGVVGPQWRDLVQFTERHAITPLVGPEFAFDDIAEAQRALESRATTGKVLVRVS